MVSQCLEPLKSQVLWSRATGGRGVEVMRAPSSAMAVSMSPLRKCSNRRKKQPHPMTVE